MGIEPATADYLTYSLTTYATQRPLFVHFYMYINKKQKNHCFSTVSTAVTAYGSSIYILWQLVISIKF